MTAISLMVLHQHVRHDVHGLIQQGLGMGGHVAGPQQGASPLGVAGGSVGFTYTPRS